MSKKKETNFEQATGYYYYENKTFIVNGEKKIIKIKKYRKPVVSKQKKILNKSKQGRD